MKFANSLFVLFSAQVLAVAVNSRSLPLSQNEMIEALMSNPHIMPRRSKALPIKFLVRQAHFVAQAYESIKRHVSHITKRQNQKSTGASIWDTLVALSGLPNALWNLSTSPNTDTAPKSLVPDVQMSKSPDYSWAKRVKVRYGPFRMPPTSEKNLDWLMWNMEGSASNLRFGIKKPCDECTILRIDSGIEYADGSSANITNQVILRTPKGIVRDS